MVLLIHNQENIPPEVKLLLYAARTKIDPEIKSKINLLIHDEIDYYYLLKIAYRNNLAPLLYWQLNAICPESIPKPILNNLKESFYKNLKKNLLLTGELIKILELFKSNEITAIPYKGPLIAKSIYGSINFRIFSDLEIFVQKEDVLECMRLLISNGYKLNTKHNIKKDQYIKKFDEYRLYNENKENIKIKILWRIPEVTFGFSTDLSNIYDKNGLTNTTISNYEVPYFSFEDLILILSTHVAGDYWKHTLCVFDIGELIRNHKIDWKKVLNNSREKSIKRILFINLLIVQDLQGVAIPEDLLREIKFDNGTEVIFKNIKKEILSRMNEDFLSQDHSPTQFKHAFLHLKMRERIIDGIKDSIIYLTKPTPKELKSLTLPDILLSLYHILRPILLLKNYLKSRFMVSPGEYHPTPCKVVAKMLSMANVGPDDIIYDLGCGDGRIIITAAKKYGAHGVGIDIDPERIKKSKINAAKKGVEHLTKFIEQDMKKTNISEASVICFYVYPQFLNKYKSKLEKELTPGTRIVSHDFEIEGWVPIKKEHVLHDWVSTIYLWELKNHEN